jgi:hypothetical protein
MRLATTVQMPSGEERLPVISSVPASDFVDPFGGLKPGTSVEWSPATLEAGEIGALVGVPTAFIDDTTYNVGASVRDELAASFAKTFERAALYGAPNMPASWPAGGLTAAANCNVVSAAEPLAAIDAALSRLEQDGIRPDGIVGGAALSAALRQQMVVSLQPFTQAPPQLWGIPIEISNYWDDGVGVALVGGYKTGVIVGVRQAIEYTTSEDGVITDTAGKVIFNALQQDSLILRAYMRIALQEVRPLSPVTATPVLPLALATVTTLPLAEKASSRK